VSAPSTVVDNLDGSRTEYFAVDATEATLLALARELFEDHWQHVIFGPCIEGAVFEGCFSERPHLSLLDGYLTVEVGGGGSWHFHLCIGPHKGTPGLPTPRWPNGAGAAAPRSSRIWTPRDGRAPGGSGCGTGATSRC